MKKLMKKGFTLTELVIVIVIIAILAAILIPTYTGYVNRSKKAIDTQLVSDLNTAVNRAIILDKSVDTISDTIETLCNEPFNYNKSDLKTKLMTNQLVWHQDTKHFYILTEDSNGVRDIETTDATEAPLPKDPTSYKYWVIYTTPNSYAAVKEDGTVDSDYSVYLACTVTNKTLTTKHGLDIGDNTENITINYTNKPDSADGKQEVVIRTGTTSATLNVEAPYDTVKHYGQVGIVVIKAVYSSCYEEYGEADYVQVESGQLIAKNDSKMGYVLLTSNGTYTLCASLKAEPDATIDEKAGMNNAVITSNNELNGTVKLTLATDEALNDSLTLQGGTTNVTEEQLQEAYAPIAFYISNPNAVVLDQSMIATNSNTGEIYGITDDGELKCLKGEISDYSILIIPSQVTVNGKTIKIKKISQWSSDYNLFRHTSGENENTQKIILAEGIEEIGTQAFRDLKKLDTVIFPKSLKKIGYQSFASTKALKQVSFPDGLETIDSMAFNSSGLVTVTIPDSVTSAYSAFNQCESLESITIGKNCSNIYNICSGCYKLTTVVIKSENITDARDAFLNDFRLTSVTLPDNITYIWSRMFCGNNIATLDLSKFKIETIDSKGFASGFNSGMGIKNLILPNTIKTIKDHAFEYYNNNYVKIESIVYKGTYSEWSNITFEAYIFGTKGPITLTCYTDSTYTTTENYTITVNSDGTFTSAHA